MPTVGVTVQIRDSETNATREYNVNIRNNATEVAALSDMEMLNLITEIIAEIIGEGEGA